MAQKRLIVRAGRGLIDVLARLRRSVGALLSVFASFILLAWANEETSPQSSREEPREVDGDEAKSYGWNNW